MPELDPSDLPPTPFWKKSIRIGLALTGFIIVGFGLVGGFRYAKLWRAHMLVEEGETLFKKKETAEQGVSKMMAAYQMEPFDPEVVRTVGEYELAVGSPLSVNFFASLAQLPDSKHTDKEAALKGLLACGDVHTAEQVSKVLLESETVADDFALQGQLFWMEREPARAIGALRHAIEMAPNNRTYQLQCAQMLVQLTDADARTEGVETLRKLAEGQDLESLHALEVLSQDPELDAAAKHWTLDKLQQHPLANDGSHLQAWELENRMGSRPTAEIMQEAFNYFKGTDFDRKAIGGRWLYAHEQAQMALDLAPLEDALQNQDLFKVRIDSLATLMKWVEVKKELTSGSVPLSQAMVYLYCAEVEKADHNSAGCTAFWEQARNSAITDSRMLGYLGDYAVRTGEWEEAKKAFQMIAHMPGLAAVGYGRLLEVETRQGNDQEILATLHDMVKDFPAKDEPKNDWAYLSLILNANVPDAQATAVDLVNANPNFLAYRTTLALSYLRTNDPGRAMGLYQGLKIDWPHAPNSWRMIYAVVLEVNGDHAGAASMAKTVDRTALRPGERDFMTTYLP